MNAIELGKFIATLRNEKGLTQEGLAEILYIDKKKVSRWECGRSMPEFDLLVKLSEIFDVTLYELSICQRVTNEKLNKRLINKFKSIKDLKKYNTKRLIRIVLFIIIIIFFLIAAIYTFKYSGTAKIYEFKSLDDTYNIYGNYIETNDFTILNILSIREKNNNKNIFNENDVCNFEMYNDGFRFIHYKKANINLLNYTISNDENNRIKNTNEIVILHANCVDKKNISKEYEFKIKLVEKYNNKLL